jgi:hypothetical protein
MPDRDLEVDATGVLVEWGSIRLIGPGRLRLTSNAMSLETTSGTWDASYEELRGASWRTGSLTVHGAQGRAAVESNEGLEFAWVCLIERACPLPELARDHRLLGSRRGGSVAAQARFLAPLLDARKRIEKEPDLETRVALLDAKQLRDRVVAALGTIARDTFPASQPDRRALEAELEEAMTGFFRQLESVDAAAASFRRAPEAVRFSAWREWANRVVDAYSRADGAWATASRFIPRSDWGQTP